MEAETSETLLSNNLRNIIAPKAIEAENYVKSSWSLNWATLRATM